MKNKNSRPICSFSWVSSITGAIIFLCVFASPGFSQETRQLTLEKEKVSEKRTALVIGNGQYQTATKLTNPANDAADMSVALKGLGFEVIVGTDLTLKQMREKVREFGDILKANGGVGLFYYAGHGVQVKGTNYLIPVDADIPREDEIEGVAYSLENVFGKLATANNGFNIVILDACRNNPFARSWSRSLDAEGLAQVNAPTGTFIAYATDANKTANDGSGRNGIYTAELLKNIGKPYLKIEEAFKEVTKAVVKVTGGKQTPWTSQSLAGDFYFVRMTRSDMYKRWARMLKDGQDGDVEDETIDELRRDPDNFVARRMSISAGMLRNAGIPMPTTKELERWKSSIVDEFGWECIGYLYGYAGMPAKERNAKILDAFSHAIKINPTFGEAYLSRGRYYLWTGPPDMAIADLSRAIELDSEDVRAYGARAQAFYRTAQYDKSITDFTKVINGHRDGSEAWGARGLAYLKSGQYDLAWTDFTKQLESDDSYGDANYNRGLVLEGKQDYSAAIREFTVAIGKATGGLAIKSFVHRAVSHSALKRYDLAIPDYTKAIQLCARTSYFFLEAENGSDQCTAAYLGRSAVYDAMGDNKSAQADRERLAEWKQMAKDSDQN